MEEQEIHVCLEQHSPDVPDWVNEESASESNSDDNEEHDGATVRRRVKVNGQWTFKEV